MLLFLQYCLFSYSYCHVNNVACYWAFPVHGNISQCNIRNCHALDFKSSPLFQYITDHIKAAYHTDKQENKIII